MVAGLMFGFAAKSKSPSHLSRGKPAALTRRTEERRSRSSHSARSRLGEEPLVAGCSFCAAVVASSTTARIVGSRSLRQA